MATAIAGMEKVNQSAGLRADHKSVAESGKQEVIMCFNSLEQQGGRIVDFALHTIRKI
jgi:hypothetical protein